MVSFNGKSHPSGYENHFGKGKYPQNNPKTKHEHSLMNHGMCLHIFFDIHYAAITLMPDDDEIRWVIYQILDYSEEQTPLGKAQVPVYPLAEDPQGDEGTMNPDEAEEFLRVQAMRGGCVNFAFQQLDSQGEHWTHVCSGPQLKSVGILLDRVYEISDRIFAGKIPHPR